MLPKRFLERMKELLCDEFCEFEAALACDAVRGMRINLIKAKGNALDGDTDIPKRKIEYVENGYFLDTDTPIGKNPIHHAGLVYMQDPGAMATLAALDTRPDYLICDFCAAPGGKTSQAAERLDSGYILSNEYVPKRTKILVQNLERLGVKNAVVTSLDTKKIAELYENVFDLAIVDAPCSGEGMFRKSAEAIEDWSCDNIAACAKRQANILENAASTVKPGGYLLYSTCTYAPEENELCVASFLRHHEGFKLVPVKEELAERTRPAIQSLAPDIENMQFARRCYPHVTEGEGQFIALMQKCTSDATAVYNFRDGAALPSKAESEIVRAFFKENFKEIPDAEVKKVGANLCLIPRGVKIPPFSVFMSGVLIGEVRGKLLFPSHQLFSAYGTLFKNRVELDKKTAESYLAGEEIDAPEGILGWCCLTYMGAALGGGKASGGKIKNHYPKGLRNK